MKQRNNGWRNSWYFSKPACSGGHSLSSLCLFISAIMWSITLLACEISEIVRLVAHSLVSPFLGNGRKTFFLFFPVLWPFFYLWVYISLKKTWLNCSKDVYPTQSEHLKYIIIIIIIIISWRWLEQASRKVETKPKNWLRGSTVNYDPIS